ncbi:hypothetical protein D0C36_18690 [Mucilaginibacter conchicola]|uniref:Lipoprotein n=1 Tax=Mucilaginibacter conchicola TaxID=2303333 RepID=A0A372NPW0_9SPHI|nr:hypothetical protein [Mucilaginibacter conchicola]RFZ90974.1 hypothetical protein D0C36_18690 [Mucilaginibacter conchicola]
MNKKLVFIWCFALFGCGPKNLDLKNIPLGQKSAVQLSDYTQNTKEQKGRFEKPTENGIDLVDKGEKITYYFFAGKDNITFNKARLANVLESKVVTYDGIVSFIGIHPDNRDAVNLLKSIITENGTPDSIIYDERKFTSVDKATLPVLQDAMGDKIKEVTDEFDDKSTRYPQRLIWTKNDILTEVIIDPTNAHLNMAVNIITKKAYADHIVIEYFKPLLKEYDSPYLHLFKK